MDVKEESFKVCGLCSQLVDESVQLDPVFRAFLVSFLELANEALPSKVCTDCYQQSFDCKKFKDRCERAIRKLSNTKLSDSMILGRSAVDKKTIEVRIGSKLSLYRTPWSPSTLFLLIFIFYRL